MTSKTQSGRSKICRYFRMCLNLNDYQFKTSRYSYKSTYMKPMVTTNQKTSINTQKLRRKKQKHNIKENHQTTREETKRRNQQRRNYKNNQKTSNKMAIITCLSIITLNVNGLNAPIKRHTVADWIKNKSHLHSAHKRLTSVLKAYID